MSITFAVSLEHVQPAGLSRGNGLLPRRQGQPACPQLGTIAEAHRAAERRKSTRVHLSRSQTSA
ncbi:hypothetical protein [Sorangium sp. So ce1151]|uniref:hypothetical protein n=1 Tax=Sorangium sp. So ce1151 TaxID=3133332 RepID=UPI003F6409C8